MSTAYPLWADRVFNAPLMINDAKLGAVMHVLRARGFNIQHDLPVDTDFMDSEPREVGGSIALIQIFGTLVHRTSGMSALSGFQSYAGIIDQVRAAVEDSSVGSILLEIASPGGEVNGAFEAAAEIRAAAEKKPVYALAHDYAFSAAYLLASAATKLYLANEATSMVGSIGVIAAHIDQSEWEKKEGLKVTTIKAGAFKDDLNPHTPLSDGAHQRLQSDIDAIYSHFVKAVSSGRGVSEDAVRGTEAGVFFAADAVRLGLADGVKTFDAVANELIGIAGGRPVNPGAAAPQSTKGEIMEDDVKAEAASNEPAAETNVIDLDAVRNEGKNIAVEIMDLCTLAGRADMAAKFIRDGVSAATVRESLLEMAAAKSDATAVNGAHAQSEQASASKSWDSVLTRKGLIG